MANVPRELPPTLIVPHCLWGKAASSFPHTQSGEGHRGTGSHGYLPPLWVHQRDPGYLTTKRKTPGLEEGILLSPSIMSFTIVTDALYRCKNTSSLTLKSLSTAKRNSWAEAPHPQWVQIFVIFTGNHREQTQVCFRKAAQVLFCQHQHLEKRDQAGNLQYKNHTNSSPILLVQELDMQQECSSRCSA